MTAHTSGPWHVRTKGSTYFYIDNAPAKEVEQFDALSGRKSKGIEHSPVAKAFGKEREANEANARLIAAAPDLLEACKNSLERFEMEGNKHGIAVCKAAIAKASSLSD